jgi:hypothetical protein
MTKTPMELLLYCGIMQFLEDLPMHIHLLQIKNLLDKFQIVLKSMEEIKVSIFASPIMATSFYLY